MVRVMIMISGWIMRKLSYVNIRFECYCICTWVKVIEVTLNCCFVSGMVNEKTPLSLFPTLKTAAQSLYWSGLSCIIELLPDERNVLLSILDGRLCQKLDLITWLYNVYRFGTKTGIYRLNTILDFLSQCPHFLTVCHHMDRKITVKF